MAVRTWCVLSVLVCELLSLSRGVWPKRRVQDLDVLIQVLHTAKELIAQAASGGQIFAGLLLPSHMMPRWIGHNRQDSVTPFLASEVAQVMHGLSPHWTHLALVQTLIGPVVGPPAEVVQCWSNILVVLVARPGSHAGCEL